MPTLLQDSNAGPIRSCQTTPICIRTILRIENLRQSKAWYLLLHLWPYININSVQHLQPIETKSLGLAVTQSESPLAKVVEDSSVVKSETNPFNAYNKFHVGAIPATNSTPTGHSARPTPIGEVNGALSWAESAYCSFWFFAWTSLAIAIAIGTQML